MKTHLRLSARRWIQRSSKRAESFQASVASRWASSGATRPAGQQAALDEHLEPVADAQDELAGGDEVVERLGEAVEHLVGEDLAGGHVVAVAEPAGDQEELEAVEFGGGFHESVDVDAFGREAACSRAKTVSRSQLVPAVRSTRAWGMEDLRNKKKRN